MASNLDYLDPALKPLEEKLDAYLEAEKALNRAKVAHQNGDYTPDLASLQAGLARLEQEIIGMLPTRDEWLKVNLGYGPSRVGAWHVPALNGAPERHELRVIH
ncbi:hypothetical protein GCM10027594_22890 [Hymenobacter agri]